MEGERREGRGGERRGEEEREGEGERKGGEGRGACLFQSLGSAIFSALFQTGERNCSSRVSGVALAGLDPLTLPCGFGAECQTSHVPGNPLSCQPHCALGRPVQP